MQAMTPLPSPSELNTLRAAINALRPDIPGLAERFTDEHLRHLHKAEIRIVEVLKCCSKQDFREAGLPIGLASLLRPGGLDRPYPNLAGRPLCTCQIVLAKCELAPSTILKLRSHS